MTKSSSCVYEQIFARKKSSELKLFIVVKIIVFVSTKFLTYTFYVFFFKRQTF